MSSIIFRVLILGIIYGCHGNTYALCPPLCQGPNEEYTSCKNPCPETCESINSSEPQPACSLQTPCLDGCDCLPDFVRDANNICIKKEDCPLKCQEHEVYNACPGYCTFDEDCGSYIYGFIRDCPAPPEDFPCYPRCDCEQGYLRINGICQLPINCCDDPYSQVVDCPAACDKTCDGSDVADCNKDCTQRACRCIPGYVRNENGNCIPTEECPLKCKEHEVYNACPRYCTFDEDCGSYIDGFIRDCPPPPDDYPCYPRCDCEKGYVRIDGICQLPVICCDDPYSQVVDCPAACDQTCDGIDVADCNKDCARRACRCIPGYVRNENGKCIPKEECPPKCLVNEKLNPCPAWCTFDADCGSYVWGFIRDCTTTPPGQVVCKPRCECIDGFVRINGTCVSANFCCKVLDAIVVNCPAACDKTCNGNDVPDCDKDRCFHKTCRCVPGFVRDDNGNCIPKENCRCDDPNAIHVKCPNPCPKTCKNLSTYGTTHCTKKCITSGCTCRDGFVEDANGKCIKPKQCPKRCKLQNEEYKVCGPPREPSCKDRHPKKSGKCKPGCFCKKGFLRNNGKCVKPSQCYDCVN